MPPAMVGHGERFLRHFDIPPGARRHAGGASSVAKHYDFDVMGAAFSREAIGISLRRC